MSSIAADKGVQSYRNFLTPNIFAPFNLHDVTVQAIPTLSV
jgi:hypothetical protein